LISSQVSQIAPRWRGRFDQERRFNVAWSLLAAFDADGLISHRFPVGQAARAYNLLDRKPEAVLQVLLTHE
jgi:threonine dehydrogenase-like Zn-dependent dehydrogenase